MFQRLHMFLIDLDIVQVKNYRFMMLPKEKIAVISVKTLMSFEDESRLSSFEKAINW